MRFMFIYECNSQSKTDALYLRPFIVDFLNSKIGIRKYGLSRCYSGSKTNLYSDSILKVINDFRKECAEDEVDGVVILVADVDTKSSEDSKRNANIIKFAKDHDLLVVWNNKDVECVFIKEVVDDKKKTKTAEDFNLKITRKPIKYDDYNLKENNPCKVPNSSNLLIVLNTLATLALSKKDR